jgi:outer membrane protein TolC
MEWQRRPTWHKPGRSRPPSPQPCRRPELINAIGLLLGEAPRTLEVELHRSQIMPRIPRRIPVSLPGTIVRRRPDVREAGARLHEATAKTGVAVASFYPDVTLNGAATVESLHLSNLFSPASAAFAMGPSISIPIFEGGQLRGALALSESHSGKRLSSFRNESCWPGSRSTMP